MSFLTPVHRLLVLSWTITHVDEQSTSGLAFLQTSLSMLKGHSTSMLHFVSNVLCITFRLLESYPHMTLTACCLRNEVNAYADDQMF